MLNLRPHSLWELSMSKTLASTYHYDPLDRLAASNSTQRFYNDTRINTEIEGERKSRFFEANSHPLALQQQGSRPGTTLLATDQHTSVLNGINPGGNEQAQAYSPFGYHPIDASLNAVGFNGERPEPITGHYLLGQGYRAFNPVLMRFNSPDSWSPFGEGGINAYAYCDNDPMNKVDPTGHLPIKFFLSKTPAWTTRHIVPSLDDTLPLSRSPSTLSLTSSHSSSSINELLGDVSPRLSRRDSTTSTASINSNNGAAAPRPNVMQRRHAIYLQEGDDELIALRAQFGTRRASEGTRQRGDIDLPPTYEEATSPPTYHSAFNDATHEEKAFYSTQQKRDDIRK